MVNDIEKNIETHLLYSRFNSINDIKGKINSIFQFGKVRSLYASESEICEEQDNLIDGEIEIKEMVYPIEVWYLFDRAGHFYITEITVHHGVHSSCCC